MWFKCTVCDWGFSSPLLWTTACSQTFFAVPEKVILWKIPVSKEVISFWKKSDFGLSTFFRRKTTTDIKDLKYSFISSWPIDELCFSFFNLKPSFCLSSKNTTWCMRCISLDREISVREQTPLWRGNSSLTFCFAAALSLSCCPKLTAMQSCIAS